MRQCSPWIAAGKEGDVIARSSSAAVASSVEVMDVERGGGDASLALRTSWLDFRHDGVQPAGKLPPPLVANDVDTATAAVVVLEAPLDCVIK